MKLVVYLAGPYRNDVDVNIAKARRVAIELWEKGYVPLCPHLNTANFEQDCKVEDDIYLEGDLNLMARCDAVIMLSGWQGSQGATIERQVAEASGIPVYEYPDLPELLPTLNRDQQCMGFLAEVMRMYRTHLVKNSDYSPANILATGEIGLVTRLWDKIARLLNLTGFEIEIASAQFNKRLNPKEESIEDTLRDAAVYSVIGLLLRKGVWGR